jgi:hypothetical protein
MSTLYVHHPHPYIEERKHHKPVKVNDQRPTGNEFQRFNSWLGLKITLIVGTMVAAYVFAAVALISLPSNIHRTQDFILWLSSSFLQLVLLPIIIVGQNIQARAADKRSEATYHDADAILHEALQIQQHLEAQDQAIERILSSVATMGAGPGTAPGPSPAGPPAGNPPPPATS